MSNITNQSEEFPTEDYLDEDKPFKHQIKKQAFCVISMLTPNSFPENKREEYKDQKILGIKVRGVFEEYKDASERASYLQKVDKYHNIFVGEVGKWLPFDVDTTNMGSEDQVYREKSLNKYMKAYKDSLQDEEQSEKERKNDMLKGANIVTDKHGAPNITGLSKLDEEEEQDLNKNDDTLKQTVNLAESKETKELNETRDEKVKLQSEVTNSKQSLQALEEKLSTINQIYSELKSK